jgi:hypothetical protein
MTHCLEYRVQRKQVVNNWYLFANGVRDREITDYMIITSGSPAGRRSWTYVLDPYECTLFNLEDAVAWCMILESEDAGAFTYKVVTV